MTKVNTASIHDSARTTGAATAMARVSLLALLLASGLSAHAQNLGSPSFSNPSEVSYRPSEKRLRAILEMSSGKYTIPNVGQETIRQFRGWDPARPMPIFPAELAPGPTLRARLGDLVEISFLNKVDDRMFPYTFVTERHGLEKSDFGCDLSGTIWPGSNPPFYYPYPGKDTFPNCFHGSSTANLHFHGTHTSPDGLSDNVLVQILPQVKQPDWTKVFNGIFDSGKIPPRWEDLPNEYKDQQLKMVGEHDKEAAAQAKKNNLPPPESLLEADLRMINEKQWPQYLIGAFPNFFEIPDYASGNFKAGQAPGTHWYHAHKHGSTSQDIRNGLAGALIIESNRDGGYDHFIRKYYGWGNSYGVHEKVFVFQEFDSNQNLERSRGSNGRPAGGPGSKQVLVNGKLWPTLTMMPGEVQLWRFIVATEGNTQGVIYSALFQTKGFTFKQTAFDGVQFSPDNYKNQPFLQPQQPPQIQVPNGLTLAAANRADLLVQAPTTKGVYTFTNVASSTSQANLFFVEVKCPQDNPNCSGNTPKDPFPTTWPDMPKFLWDLPKPGPDDVKNPDTPVKFQWEPKRTGTGLRPTPSATTPSFAPHFMINDKQFEEHGPRVDQCMPLNGLQDWVLENYTTLAHPFHIHINPFQIIRMEIPSLKTGVTNPTKDDDIQWKVYEPKDNHIWADVIAIPVAVMSADGSKIWPGKITIRQKYLDFTGTYVLHCHILAHEDRGMMQLVRVVPASDYPAGCQKGIPEHH